MSTSRFTGSTLNAWRGRHGLQVDEMAWVFGYSIGTLKDKLYSRSSIRLDTESNSRVGRSSPASRICAAWLADTTTSLHPPERRPPITLCVQRCGRRVLVMRRLSQRARANVAWRLSRNRTNTIVRSAIDVWRNGLVTAPIQTRFTASVRTGVMQKKYAPFSSSLANSLNHSAASSSVTPCRLTMKPLMICATQ
jgi:hypothetical protein